MDDRTPATAAARGAAAAAAPDIGGVAGVLSAREAAAALGVSERTVRRAIERGDLVATKHAGSFQITPAAIDAYRRAQTGQGGQRPTDSDAAPAAPLSTAAAADAPAAAADSAGGDALAVLRQMLAEERERADRHMTAAALWQERARVLEGRLLALGAGDVANVTDQDAPRTRQDGPGATEPPRPGLVPGYPGGGGGCAG